MHLYKCTYMFVCISNSVSLKTKTHKHTHRNVCSLQDVKKHRWVCLKKIPEREKDLFRSVRTATLFVRSFLNGALRGNLLSISEVWLPGI